MEEQMTKARAMQEMQELVDMGNADPEASHGRADDVLCAFLRHLGHDDLVDLFDKVDKWYA